MEHSIDSHITQFLTSFGANQTMTSWPWMKGVEVAIADPVEPVCTEDDRPAVKALILKHSEKIDKIKTALEDDPLYNPKKHDDLWILRFWLSHKKSKAAIEAAKHTLEFRKKYHLDELDIRKMPPQEVKDGKLAEYNAAWKRKDGIVCYHPDPKRGVIVFIAVEARDQNVLVEKLSEDYWLPALLYLDEYSFQCLDYVTRTTGRLTKLIRFADCRGLSLGGLNMECTRRDARFMALMEDCYPQMTECIFVCNAPTLIGVIWKTFSPFFPKRVRSKFDIVYPKDNAKDHKKLLRYISEENIPDIHEGKNPASPEKCTSDETSNKRAEVYWWW
ncbi:expressed unknown protein [Seminavis robusta]|uniref:CRAL-TRIO domain-containing protein n=1 Tax=Seminavis robusta TaxID=568900 RepID=A0A9N8D9A9_9STRA|nr:expressed unknown protein [Seminavis robusta]|eukprot:Sro43_g026371.1  (331) ;mRNA; f:137084-138076